MASRTSTRLGQAGSRLLAPVGLALAMIALAACTSAGAPPAPTVSPTATAAPSVAASPSIAATAAASVAATTGPCDPARLAARITLWEGAAGSRIAHVELTNAGTVACLLPSTARPQLVDGKGSVLIDGNASASPSAAATSAPALTMSAGGVVKALVRAGNYCGPAASAPVTVAFVLAGGGRFVATPFSPTDAGVPPCLGAAGSTGTVEMQPWAP